MVAMNRLKVCHLASVHKATDTRIFYKECRSLSGKYKVYLIAQAKENYEKEGVHVIALKPPKNRLQRFFITDVILLAKGIRVNADIYHFHDPELIGIGLILKLF